MRVNAIHRVGMLIAMLLGVAIHGCGQNKSNLTTYETPNYSVNHPSDWLVSNDGGIVNIYPKDNNGAVTISFHSGITFPLEETKSLILEMNQIVDSPDKVKMVKDGESIEFTHDYLDKKNNRHWFTKAIRKDSDFFLITINCDEKYWENQKANYFSVVESFKIKS